MKKNKPKQSEVQYQREYQREYRLKNRELLKEKARQRMKNESPEEREKRLAELAEWRRNNKEYAGKWEEQLRTKDPEKFKFRKGL